MNIAVIGGGLTGLTTAYELLKKGHRVTVFEKEKTLGGLTGGFKMPTWEWSLEFFYHHFFTNDTALISLAKELGLEKEMVILRPITATLIKNNLGGTRLGIPIEHPQSRNLVVRTLYNLEKMFMWSKDVHKNIEQCGVRMSDGETRVPGPKEYSIFQLDSPLNLLTFPLLTPIDKLRTAGLLAFCKLNPFWQPLEKITAEQLFKTIGGSASWRTLWQPLMKGKFGTYAKVVPASWLWARIKKRTPSLGYFRGGFQTFVDRLAKAIKKRGGDIRIKYQVSSIKYKKKNNYLTFDIGNLTFDKVLITTPSSTASTLLMSLVKNNKKNYSYIRNDSIFVDEEGQLKTYNQRLLFIPHLWAQTLILETEKPILDNTYWLNIADPSFPFIAVVAHTNYMDKKYYGGRHITYIGTYLPDNHPFLKMTKQQLLKKFLPYLQKINPSFRPLTSALCHLFTAPSAQPVHTLNYSQKAPKIKTPVEGIYLANLDSIYPWDRGTNYAVEMGQKAAKTIQNSL